MELIIGIGTITLVISLTTAVAFHKWLGKKFKTLMNRVAKNTNLKFSYTEEKLANIIARGHNENDCINFFIRNQLLLPATLPFHTKVITDKLLQLKHQGISNSKIHSLLKQQIIEVRNEFESSLEDTNDLNEFQFERRVKVEQILKPPLKYPDSTLSDIDEENENYYDLFNRFNQLSKFEFPTREIFRFYKFLYKLNKETKNM